MSGRVNSLGSCRLLLPPAGSGGAPSCSGHPDRSLRKLHSPARRDIYTRFVPAQTVLWLWGSIRAGSADPQGRAAPAVPGTGTHTAHLTQPRAARDVSHPPAAARPQGATDIGWQRRSEPPAASDPVPPDLQTLRGLTLWRRGGGAQARLAPVSSRFHWQHTPSRVTPFSPATPLTSDTPHQ